MTGATGEILAYVAIALSLVAAALLGRTVLLSRSLGSSRRRCEELFDVQHGLLEEREVLLTENAKLREKLEERGLLWTAQIRDKR